MLPLNEQKQNISNLLKLLVPVLCPLPSVQGHCGMIQLRHKEHSDLWAQVWVQISTLSLTCLTTSVKLIKLSKLLFTLLEVR